MGPVPVLADTIEAADFAGFAEDSELRFQPIDQLKGRRCSTVGLSRAPRKHDFEHGRHRSLSEAKES